MVKTKTTAAPKVSLHFFASDSGDNLRSIKSFCQMCFKLIRINSIPTANSLSLTTCIFDRRVAVKHSKH